MVVLAQEEARALRHGYIGTEHILLGLLREEEGVAATSLESLGLTAELVRAQVVRIVGLGEEPSEGQIPFTPRAKRVLEFSLRESLSLGHNHIGTEHILLALTGEGEGVGARVLLDFDLDSEMIRDEVIRGLSGPRAARTTLRHRPVMGAWLDGLRPHADQLGLEIRRALDRYPDSGDLLLALGCTEETVAGRALKELGVDLDALQLAIEGIRREDAPRVEQQLHEVRRAKERAIEAGDLDEAARLRDEERHLLARSTAAGLVGPETLEEIRRRLGLSRGEGT